MTNTKVQNYTDVQTSTLLEMYAANADIKTIAESLGKSVRSITMKLVREGVYKKAEKASTATHLRKAELATAIVAKFELDEAVAEDLGKLTKATLEALLNA